MSRGYDNRNRARAAGETTRRMLDVAEALLCEGPVATFTLDEVARRAGVSVQTVLRHVGSRSGLFEAVAGRVRERIASQRAPVASGDVDAALSGLLAHYEAEGVLVLALLAQEAADPLVAAAVAEGRRFHRVWVEGAFAPWLGEGAEVRADALVAATDIYVWKLLRLDLGRSAEQVSVVIRQLVAAVLEAR